VLSAEPLVLSGLICENLVAIKRFSSIGQAAEDGVVKLCETNYQPCGPTALYDAARKAIDAVNAHLASQRTAGTLPKVMFVIITDGLDGSSLTTSVEVRQAIDDLRQTGCLKASALILLTNDGCGLGREQLDQIRSSMGFSQVIILEKNARNVGLAFKLATRLKSDETIPS
jgi:hypothetical protein